MIKKFKCILLVDDSEDCNYMHKFIIDNVGCTEQINVCINGQEAIDYLKSSDKDMHPHPNLIFLDINMPVMDGWEFLEEYAKLDDNLKEGTRLFMLSTSINPKDIERADNNKYVSGFFTKFLEEKDLNNIIENYFDKD